MATKIEVELLDGIKIGEAVHTAAVLREATAADLIDATEESERVVPTQQGYTLLASPTMVALHTLRRQIVAVGDFKGPLAMGEIRKLSSRDLSLPQEEAMKLETATLEETARRGRD